MVTFSLLGTKLCGAYGGHTKGQFSDDRVPRTGPLCHPVLTVGYLMQPPLIDLLCCACRSFSSLQASLASSGSLVASGSSLTFDYLQSMMGCFVSHAERELSLKPKTCRLLSFLTKPSLAMKLDSPVGQILSLTYCKEKVPAADETKGVFISSYQRELLGFRSPTSFPRTPLFCLAPTSGSVWSFLTCCLFVFCFFWLALQKSVTPTLTV